jgi:3-oxoadipate enol-lactonase
VWPHRHAASWRRDTPPAYARRFEGAPAGAFIAALHVTMSNVHIDGVTLHYEEEGDRRRPPIVLAHSVLFGTEIFDDLAAELAQDFYVVRVDVHGHGRSGFRTPQTIDAMVADFHALLRHLDLGPVTWVGYSIGGMIGMRLALAQPEAIDRLVLVATAASAEPAHLVEAAGTLWTLYAAGHREDVADAALPFFFSPTTLADQPDLVARHRRSMVEREDVAGIVAAARAAMQRDDVAAKLGAIRVPTLIVAGREDIGASDVAEAERMAAAIGGAQLAIVERANHLLAVERPREFVDVVSAFLRSARR